MAKIFISYRRADSIVFTGRIYDRLVAQYGRQNVFKDVDDIPAGVNFASYIQQSLRECAVELAVIGPSWLDIRDDNGKRRLDDPADFVRIEIETAFAFGLRVIPLLLDGTTMPPAARLPESLRQLALINGRAVRNDPDFSRDMERVFISLAPLIGSGVQAPGELTALLTEAAELRKQKKYGEAIALYEHATRVDSRNFHAWLNLSGCYSLVGQEARAVDAAERAIALDTNNANAWHNKASALIRLSRFSEALAAEERSLAINPSDAYAWNTAGVALMNLARYLEALNAYDRALALDPTYAAPWRNKAIIFRILGRPLDAQEAERRAQSLGT